MGFFSNEEFIRYKKCTQPVYQTPASIQQMLDIAGVHENGIFEIEPNNGAGTRSAHRDSPHKLCGSGQAAKRRHPVSATEISKFHGHRFQDHNTV